MSISVFLQLVEVKAKTAWFSPFLLGTLFAWYRSHTLHISGIVGFLCCHAFVLTWRIMRMTTIKIIAVRKRQKLYIFAKDQYHRRKSSEIQV